MRKIGSMAPGAVAALAVLATVAVAPSSAAAATNLVSNGSFEETGGAAQQGWGGYTFGEIYSAPLPGWTLVGGSVDVTVTGPGSASALWGPAADGFDALDINGWDAGEISQSLATKVGQTYRVTFDYSRNVAGAPYFATANVSAGGNTFNVAAANDGSFGSPFNMIWKTGSFTFTGTGADIIDLKATIDGNGGVFFDKVSVTGVPEPTSWALMIGGFGLTGAALRRRGLAARAFAAV